MAQFEFISQRNRERYFKIVGPVADLFARAGIHPNILSIAGLVLSIAAGLIYCHGSFFWAAWVVVLAGICDTLDGRIARQTNKKSDFGAFSTAPWIATAICSFSSDWPTTLPAVAPF